jgi:hypothetical protein
VELDTSADSSAKNRGAESVRSVGVKLDTSADSSAENRGAESVRPGGRKGIQQQTVLQKTEEQNL